DRERIAVSTSTPTASGSPTHVVKVFELSSGKDIQDIGENLPPFSCPVQALAFNPDARLMTACVNEMKVWNLSSGHANEPVPNFADQQYSAIVLSSDGTHFAAISPGTVKV